MSPIPHQNPDDLMAVALTLGTFGAFPIKVCRVTDHKHPKDADLCGSPGKRPWEAGWSKQDRDSNFARLDDWVNSGWGVGIVPTGDLLGIDEDVVGGLDVFFEALGEAVPLTIGDVVPLTGKRHIWVRAYPGFDVTRLVNGSFYGPDGKSLGEVARSAARHFVLPGNVWRKGDQYDVRKWNGVDTVATLSEAATKALLARNEGGTNAPPRPEERGGEWQWDEETGDEARHILLRNKARELRGSISDPKTLTDIVWAWGQTHGLTGMAKGREVTYDEVRDLCERAIRKYDEDPAPITVLFPKAEDHQRQQEQERQEEQAEERATTLDTLFSLPFGTPPPPLVKDMFIAAEGWTVLYANGGSGKGLLALWMAHEYLLANPEARVCVLDYEAHQWEWGNRARAMQWTDDELKRVLYVNPYDDVWKKGHTLDGLAPSLAPLTKRLDIGLYVVDSFATGVKSGSEMGGADSAVGFFKAGAQLGAPGLVLAHTAATTERFPAKPFGSSHIHNQARETWAQAKTDVIEMGPKKGQFGVTSTVMQVELANKKRSVGAQPLGRQGFDIEFTSLGAIEVRWNGAQGASVSQMVLDVLATAARGMTVKALRDAITEDTGAEVSRNTLEHTVRSMSDRGEIDVLGDARPKTYGLPRMAADED